MRVVMSFCTKGEPSQGAAPPGYRRVVTGPAWGAVRTQWVFELMELRVSTVRGMVPLAELREGIATARRNLPLSAIAREAEESGTSRDELAQCLDSLATWATVASMQGATDVAWMEDF